MGTVQAYTAARMLAIENSTIVDARIDSGDLILIQKDLTEINVGPVVGSTGPTGDMSVADKNNLQSDIDDLETDLAAEITSGSNADGEWMKFADGIMVCQFRDATFTYPAYTQYGSSALYTGLEAGITFPSAFNAPPAVLCGEGKWSTGAGWVTPESVTATNFSARFFDISARTSADYPFSYTAIGTYT